MIQNNEDNSFVTKAYHDLKNEEMALLDSVKPANEVKFKYKQYFFVLQK